MGNWKQLGVVPDSDDEGWGSEDSQPLLSPHTPSKPLKPQADPQSEAVWDFPGSPEPPQTTRFDPRDTQIPTFVPQPTSPSNVRQAASQLLGSTLPDLGGGGTSLELARESPDSLTDFLQGDISSNTQLSRRDDMSLSIVQITAPSANPFPGSSLDESPRETPRDDGRERIGRNSLTESSSRSDQPPATQPEAPTRAHRSLRPRKPIQEHPYLLENAQYSKLVKSHGVKPVRISAEEREAMRRRNEDDSQDNDYMALGGPDEEPQRRRKKTERRKPDDDLDELALSQSPRTSSPQGHLRASSEQSPGQQTDATSISDDEEFPDIRDLTVTRTKMDGKPSKRRLPSAPSTSRKRPRAKQTVSWQESPLRNRKDAWDLPSSPGPSDATSRHRMAFYPNTSPRLLSLPTSRRFLTSPTQLGPRFDRVPAAESMDLTHLTGDSEPGRDNMQNSDGSSTESDSEMVRRTGRRIRGVLPASWLRLDQQTRKKTIPNATRRRSPPQSPDQPRPGLATRKVGGSRPIVSGKSFLDELHGDKDNFDEGDGTQRQPDSISDREPIWVEDDIVNLDDTNSVVEEDFIDWMLPGQKRNRTALGGPPRKRKKLKQKVFEGEARKLFRQQKISTSIQHLNPPSEAKQQIASRREAGRLHRAVSPPALSIVDFVEPGAPEFIKVAARAASRRHNMGRSKPSNKTINLGNRTDNVDALSVLKAWRTGKIKASKAPRAIPQQKLSTARPPLRWLSANVRQQSKSSARLSFTQLQKVTRQVSVDRLLPMGELVTRSEGGLAEPAEVRSSNAYARNANSRSRPAQLEANVPEDLAARKKMLDLVFRRNRNEVLAPTFQLRRITPNQEPATPLPPETSARMAESDLEVLRLERAEALTSKMRPSRTRKLVPPRRLDLEAPQFKHANDPLPSFDMLPVEDGVEVSRQERNRISGLGPFGTHYTQHFDVFPLHGDTFFHQNTIIGNGTLNKAMSSRVSEIISCARPTISFKFSSHTFTWGRWTDTLSSELGLVFDLLAKKLEENTKQEAWPNGQGAILCVDYILRFMLDSVSVDDESDLSPFVHRSAELLLGFMDQTRPAATTQQLQHTLIQVNSRLLICALVLFRFCQGAVELSNEVQQVEELLKRLAKAVIEQLLENGLSEVRTTCDDLQRLSFRERGIRNDMIALTCWVILIKVLGSAQMPRAGFWDLTCPAMAGHVHQITDAQKLEGLWRDMFTLLPLGEFDDVGVLNKGMRYVVPLQGWALPKKLLKCVFESYRSNQRQSPSFNGYCRALLGRCHCLLEQWGWHKCVGIVGMIFDFFGHHNLSHMRNEEVYKSPRFLEELCIDPDLSIKSEDRCFHIFLKTLAVAIQRMRQRGLSNDVRNLIARCLPNHNRQYSKEQTIHSQDLASLRNHHDVLCTLFWAAPPEERRPVYLFEKLVQPASSHKEACLINMRAWSQLARFVVSSGGSIQDFRPFMSWQNNVFQQILNQYLSAGADVQHQFMSLAKEDRGDIQQQFLDSVVAANQAAAKDVLYCSVVASLDVMKHCPTLNSSIFSFNVSQTSKVFSKLITIDKDSDWGILRACFETIDLFVKRLEDLRYKLRESSAESISSHGNREFEDAVEFLDDKVIQGFFVAVRRAMVSCAYDAAPQQASKSVVVEKAIILCGRIASLFIDGGRRQLQHFFAAGKYGLFEALPQELSLTEKRFVPLFVATLLKNHIFNFSSICCNYFDIWISSLVKPYHALRYENYLADTLKALDVEFMKGAIATPGAVPDYNQNREFFANGISYMRREIREAEAIQRKPLRAKYEKLLRSVMQQIKADIKSLKLDSVEHQDYISFVREIVGLIKSHGADICTIDPFYYQVSAEYSPAKEDPLLHTAGILAYGLKLGEGETTAIPQLFHYLYNHFKASLASGQLDAESKIIESGMEDDNILAFILGRMLPAIIRASSQSSAIWPLLDVYSKSVQHVLSRSALPREIPETCAGDVLALLGALLGWIQNLAESSSGTAGLTPTQAYILTELMAVCNAMRPYLMCWLMQPSADPTRRLRQHTKEITRVMKQAAVFLGDFAIREGRTAVRDVPVRSLLGLTRKNLTRKNLSPTLQSDSHVNSFAQILSREVKHSWNVGPDIITVRVAAGSSAQTATQSARGVKNDLDTRAGLLSELFGSLKAWTDEMGGEGADDESNRPRGRRRQRTGRFTPAVVI